MRVLRFVTCAFILAGVARPAFAQSTNTATILVTVVDQNGGIVKDAKVTVTNPATSATRDVQSLADGSASFAALSLVGTYTIHVVKAGFTADDVTGLSLRSGETVTVKIKLVATGGHSEVTVYGTTEGVKSNPQIGRILDSQQIEDLPILGRKVTTLPLFNSSFRSGKGIGDLFVNATYFVTGSGSRRTTTFMLDGATNDESWGRQTAALTVPIGSVEEAAVLTNAFSAEFGWTAGPAMNLVTKSGTNALHGDGLYMIRPGGWQANSFSTKGFCPPSISTCVTPASLTSISPVDIPDRLNQFSASAGGPISKNKTFFFGNFDYTLQNRTTALSPTLPSFVLDNGALTYEGKYRQYLVDGRVDHKISTTQSVMVRVNVDHMYDTNPQDTVSGTTAPTAAREYTRGGWSLQSNHTAILSTNLLNEARLSFTDADPVTQWSAPVSGTIYQRTAGASPFKVGANQVSDLYSRQLTFSDTLSWTRDNHTVRFGGAVARHFTGGIGNEPGQQLLGTFTFTGSGPHASLPFDQLTLADVTTYAQPYSFGAPPAYTLNQWLTDVFVQDSYRVRSDLTLDLGLRYDRQSLTQSTKDFAPRFGFGWHPRGDARLAVRGGYGIYYTQIQSNLVAGYLQNGLDGFTSYTASPGQVGFPTCLGTPTDNGCTLPIQFSSDPKQAPARNITIVAGKRGFYAQQFAQFGLDFSKVPNYPDQLLNPQSQVATIGLEREIRKGLFVSADYVHQHWGDLVRTVDLNAPTPFDRTASGQVRSVAAANATRPITPTTGGVTQINTIMNLGNADYDGLETMFSYKGSAKWYASVNYTLSKATNTTEPDGNGINPNQPNIAGLGETERGPSVLDQRHRAVITFTYNLLHNFTVGTVTMLASARPINPVTGVDNDGDGSSTNDRPVINGSVVSKSSFRGTGTQDVSIFFEGRLKRQGRTITLRVEGFNLFNHANLLGRGVNTFGDTGTAASSFGQFATVAAGATTAIPAFANIDPPRMFQIQLRYQF
jgi:hypothetical protein